MSWRFKKTPTFDPFKVQIDSNDAKARQALTPSEPSLSLTYSDSPKFFQLGSAASTVYQITQPIGFPGKAILNQSALRDQSKAIYHQLRSKRLQVASQARSAYYGLALTRRNIEINLDQKRSFDRILAVAKRRYEAGSITQVDLMIAQTALYSNENDQTDLDTNEKSLRAQLNLLLGNPPEGELQIEPLKSAPLKSFNREETIKKMVDNRPEIQSAVYQQRSAEKSYNLAWMSILPDFQLYLGTTYYNAPYPPHRTPAPRIFNTPTWLAFSLPFPSSAYLTNAKEFGQPRMTERLLRRTSIPNFSKPKLFSKRRSKRYQGTRPN